MLKLTSLVLSLALLAPAGTATAQGGAQALYFVFKLATTLPLTVQETPECAAQQAAWTGALAGPGGVAARDLAPAGRAPVPHSPVTHSFVSEQGGAALRLDIEDFARVHSFAVAELWPGQTAGAQADGVDRAPNLQYADVAVSGFGYGVRVYERPGVPGSVLCVTVLPPTSPDDPDTEDR